MKRKLLVLDIVLAALVIYAAQSVRERYLENRKREQVVLGRPLPRIPEPPFAAIKPPEAPVPAAYNDVAQKMLFSADRNPAIVVEVEKPKPMPGLPVVYGVMDLGEGASAFMSAKSNEPHSEVKPGQKIGEFTLVAVSNDQIVLDWEGKKITKKVTDLMAQTAPPASSDAAPAQAAQPKAQAASATPSGPGRDLGGGWKSCDPGDSSPDGTVRDGWKKVIRAMPIGQTCHWEPAK